MNKSFLKNLIRDIKKTLSRFLSIVIIIAVGVSFYAGVRATSPNMKMSADKYFEENNFMDYKILSTLGITEDDVLEVSKIQGVTEVQGAYSLDAVIQMENKELVLNINAMPQNGGINDLKIVKGRKAQNASEAVIEAGFFEDKNLKLGEKIVLQSGTEKSISENLNANEFTIVGTAESPLYASQQRQLSSVGNGNVQGFVYIMPELFKSEVYTEVYVRTSSELSETSLIENESYVETSKTVQELLEELGVVRGKIRYDEIVKEANDKINEGENELNNAKKEAAQKFTEGYEALEDAKQKIAAGEEELNKKTAEIEAAEDKLAVAQVETDSGQQKLSEGKAQAAEGLDASVGAKLLELKALVDSDPTNQDNVLQYQFLSGVYENDIKGKMFDDMYKSLETSGNLEVIDNYTGIKAIKTTFDSSQRQIDSAREEIAKNEKVLDEGAAKIEAAWAEIEKNKAQISESEEQLRVAEDDGTKKMNAAKAEIELGEKEIAENTAKLKEEEEKANVKFAEAEAKIVENRNKLSEIKEAEWYVLGRTANVGYETYRLDSDRIDSIGKAFPLIFFLVAALVSLTTMTRMVQEKRTEIGTFKALGYSSGAIVGHYLIYALTASVLGTLIGIVIGFKLFPPLIMNAYSSLYSIPNSVVSFDGGIALQAALIAILFTTLAAVASTLDELKEEPASLMRPKPPKSGKKILLENISFVWNRLSFTKKVTARNIFRYKQRFFMTVIGIGACTGLMITGFGLKSGIVGATERQFNYIYKYEMSGTLEKSVDFSAMNEKKEKMMQDSNVESVMFSYSKNGSVNVGGSKSEDAHIVVVEDSTLLNEYINLNDDGENLELSNDGVIVTQKFAKLIGKKAGDTFTITVDEKNLEVKISAITEQYVMHYVYFSPEYYKQVSGGELKYNSFYGLVKDSSQTVQDETGIRLKTIEGLNSISFRNTTQADFDKGIKSINSVVLVLIVSAGVLAFVVIFNLTNININERRRELATIKLLGFYNSELAAYIYRENIILTMIGSIAGIFMGIFLNRFVVSTAETNVMMFLKTIDPIYFVYSIVITMMFSIIVNLAMYSRFDKIDMIESLKNAE